MRRFHRLVGEVQAPGGSMPCGWLCSVSHPRQLAQRTSTNFTVSNTTMQPLSPKPHGLREFPRDKEHRESRPGWLLYEGLWGIWSSHIDFGTWRFQVHDEPCWPWMSSRDRTPAAATDCAITWAAAEHKAPSIGNTHMRLGITTQELNTSSGHKHHGTGDGRSHTTTLNTAVMEGKQSDGYKNVDSADGIDFSPTPFMRGRARRISRQDRTRRLIVNRPHWQRESVRQIY